MNNFIIMVKLINLGMGVSITRLNGRTREYSTTTHLYTILSALKAINFVWYEPAQAYYPQAWVEA